MAKELPDKIVVTITSPRVISIMQNRKSGVTQKFATETAIEKLYDSSENSATKKLLFEDDEVIPKEKKEEEKTEKQEEKPQEQKEGVKKFEF